VSCQRIFYRLLSAKRSFFLVLATCLGEGRGRSRKRQAGARKANCCNARDQNSEKKVYIYSCANCSGCCWSYLGGNLAVERAEVEQFSKDFSSNEFGGFCSSIRHLYRLPANDSIPLVVIAENTVNLYRLMAGSQAALFGAFLSLLSH